MRTRRFPGLPTAGAVLAALLLVALSVLPAAAAVGVPIQGAADDSGGYLEVADFMSAMVIPESKP